MPPKLRLPLKIKAKPKAPPKAPPITEIKEQKNDSLYKEITESPMAKEFYDIVTSKEFINYSADFIKALAGIWLYQAVYNASAPTPPVIDPPPEIPVLRGTVIPSRRGVVIPNDDNFGIAPEDVIRESGVDTSNLSSNERRQLHDFAEGAIQSRSNTWNDLVDLNASNANMISNLRTRVREVLRKDESKSDIGLGLMDDIKSYKISERVKSIGKDAFKALLLAGLAGAVGAYSVHDMNKSRNINHDAERTTPVTISTTRQSPYDYSDHTKNWANEVKNKRIMNSILSEFDDLSEDVSSLSSNFSSDSSYGRGLKKTRSKKNIKMDTIKFPEVLNTSKISKVNNKIKDAILYIYSKSPSKETIMTFMAVIFALGASLLLLNSQPLTDDLLNKIMDFKRILIDCGTGAVSLKGVQAYVEYYLEQILNFGVNSYNDTFGGRVKSTKVKKIKKATIKMAEIPTGFYERRIKPIAKKVYDVIVSDESITVAKTLAQVAFLSLVMYGIRELGTSARGAVARPNDDARLPRQILEDLADAEISRPTYYTEASGRNRGEVIEYDKSQYPREYPTDVGSTSKYHEDYDPYTAPSKINRMLADANSDIYTSKPRTDALIEALKNEDPIHIKNLMLKHPILRDTKSKKPHKFTTEFAEHLPTLQEKINWKKGQMLSGKGLKEDAIVLSKVTISKLKKIAKKIYDKIKSEEGQTAVKGLTIATILAGLTALIRSRMEQPRQLSPGELKEQYMANLGEDVLFQ